VDQRYLVNFDLQQLDKQVADLLVVGSGVAGLTAALTGSRYGRVVLLSKSLLEGNTAHAQGGIAAAIGSKDHWRKHWEDTIRAGAGLCDEQAVSILVREGPDRIRELMALGARFDMAGGSLALAREGGHSCHRILHAGGDATGREIERALAEAVRQEPGIRVVAPAFAVDLLTVDGHCCGVLAADAQGRLTAYLARATIVATGGAAQVYSRTTGSPVVTGDGMAMAYRAGAELMDMEFVQFHPTGLKVPDGSCPLITEAARGEGGILLDHSGRRFMPAVHPMAELAPRDVVARAIAEVMQDTRTDHVWLDLRHLTGVDLAERFPTVFETCRAYGLDIRTDLIPVSPVAHYFMGGIRTDYHGRTSLPGLYACGEAACLAVHGANRLASNSLLDGLVYGHRAAEAAAQQGLPLSDQELLRLKIRHDGAAGQTTSQQAQEIRDVIQKLMWDHVGLVRSGAGLDKASRRLAELRAHLSPGIPHPAIWETANLLTVAQLITRAAALRTESRGSHYRLDYPERDDEHWLTHIVFTRDGTRVLSKEEVFAHELAQPAHP